MRFQMSSLRRSWAAAFERGALLWLAFVLPMASIAAVVYAAVISSPNLMVLGAATLGFGFLILDIFVLFPSDTSVSVALAGGIVGITSNFYAYFTGQILWAGVGLGIIGAMIFLLGVAYMRSLRNY